MLAILANAAIYVVPFLIVITVIVTVHEFGHFLTARAFGVKVDRFSIGFGRTIAAFKDRWGVEWRIAWLPLGGYVRFAGDDNAASVPDQDDLDALNAGGGTPAAMNAANEVGVAAFLDRRIGFLDIAALVAETLDELGGAGELTQDSNTDPLEWAMAIDASARRTAAQVLSRFAGRG